MPPLTPHLSRARERLCDCLQLHCAAAELVADVVLCLEEACTNVIRHSGASETMQVSLRFTDGALVRKVRDHGRGFDIDGLDIEAVPDPLAGGGRGLEVHMVKRAAPRCSAQGPKTGSDEGCDQSRSGTRQT